MLFDPSIRALIGGATVVIGIYGYIPYFRGIFKGHNRPHLFSWLIWGLLTAIGWAAQISAQAGPGAWITGLTALACLSIAGLSLKYGERQVTGSDWLMFIGALAAIPIWTATKDPLASVVLISIIDAMALYPTFRKTWAKPQEEVLTTHAMSSAKFFLSLLALDKVSFVTVCYPASIVVSGIIFVATALIRRKTIYA